MFATNGLFNINVGDGYKGKRCKIRIKSEK